MGYGKEISGYLAKAILRLLKDMNWWRFREMLLDTGQKIGIAGAAIGIFGKNNEALSISVIILAVYFILVLILPGGD